jgi:hypothetical protein
MSATELETAESSEFQAQLGLVAGQEPSQPSQPNSLVGPGRKLCRVGPRGTLKWPASALLVKAVEETVPCDCNPSWL